MGNRYSLCYRDVILEQIHPQCCQPVGSTSRNSQSSGALSGGDSLQTMESCNAELSSAAAGETLLVVRAGVPRPTDIADISASLPRTQILPTCSSKEEISYSTNVTNTYLEKGQEEISYKNALKDPMDNSHSSKQFDYNKKGSVHQSLTDKEKEDTFQDLLQQLFAVVPTGSISTVIVLLSSYSRIVNGSESLPKEALIRILLETRWYRYRDLPLLYTSPTKKKEFESLSFVGSTCFAVSPREENGRNTSLGKMVATDMTILHVAAVYGHFPLLEYLLSPFTHFSGEHSRNNLVERNGNRNADKNFIKQNCNVHDSKKLLITMLNASDPVFGMTPCHMMLLAHQTTSVLSVFRWLEAFDTSLFFADDLEYLMIPESHNCTTEQDLELSLLYSVCSATTTAGKTLLHLIVEEQEVELLQKLLASLLSVAVHNPSVLPLSKLLSLWCRQEDSSDSTVLHWASMLLSSQIIECMVRHWYQLILLSISEEGRESRLTIDDCLSFLKKPNSQNETALELLQHYIAAFEAMSDPNDVEDYARTLLPVEDAYAEVATSQLSSNQEKNTNSQYHRAQTCMTLLSQLEKDILEKFTATKLGNGSVESIENSSCSEPLLKSSFTLISARSSRCASITSMTGSSLTSTSIDLQLIESTQELLSWHEQTQLFSSHSTSEKTETCNECVCKEYHERRK